MSLYSEIDAIDKKKLFKSDDHVTSYSTGLTVLDYANGYWTSIIDENGERKIVPVLGITNGSLVSIIGNTGTGKSTLATQIGWNIVKPFDDGLLTYYDCEKLGMTRQRMVTIAGTDYDNERIRLIKTHTSIEDVLDGFNTICELKESGGKKFMYEVKGHSYTGQSFWQYVPTVMIIDSLPAFNSGVYNVEDLGNNIDQMKASKDITRFYTNILDRAWRYNIIFIVINHIKANTVMNPYQQPPQGLMMINPQCETLPRGLVAQYFSNVYFRIRSKKSAAYTIEDNGFTGLKCDITMAKTKTNTVGTTFPVTLTGERGFDPYYSIYEFADSLGLIQGRQPYLYFKGMDDRKFNRKDFVNRMVTDKSFRDATMDLLKPYFEMLLGPKDSLGEDPEKQIIKYGDIEGYEY